MSRLSLQELKQFTTTLAFCAFFELLRSNWCVSQGRALDCWPQTLSDRRQREETASTLKDLARRNCLPESHPDFFAIKIASVNTPIRLCLESVTALLPKGLVGDGPICVVPSEHLRQLDLDLLSDQLRQRVPTKGEVRRTVVYYLGDASRNPLFFRHRSLSPDLDWCEPVSFGDNPISSSFSNGVLDFLKPRFATTDIVTLTRDELVHVLENFDFLMSANAALFMAEIQRRQRHVHGWEVMPDTNDDKALSFPQAQYRTQEGQCIGVAFAGALGVHTITKELMHDFAGEFVDAKEIW